ncbi:hypothetical protein [Mariprofundus ferrooxydans]|uniref:Uncharacterized protein n=1 Tax=Mariprofundus ferrooxydans PV-1 TaxID=314345 RepID=Q0EWA8_9PROT|nr:hypothetical protein [Mariprofundus ferrooxydans]EAU53563.1 hypothetical protein SPV1_02958 [Mariprofundus ferrooxydans PV-1]KON46993.1 hypothetical protein AL013_10380 [Mariprofundus ferrooxydans]
MRKVVDSRTLDLFSVPVQSTIPGALNLNLEVPGMLSLAIKDSGMDRDVIAFQMSRLTGDHISEDMLNAWTAKSKTQWRFPLQYLAAFEVATGTHLVSHHMAEKCGGTFLIGADVLQARLGKRLSQKKQLEEEIRDLQKRISGAV